jgi:hypothetical protein
MKNRPATTFYLLIIAFLLSIVSGAVHADQTWRTIAGDSTDTKEQWTDFFHSSSTLFRPNTGYRISFDYKIAAICPGAKFFLVINDITDKSKNLDWQEWDGAPGKSGKISSMFIDRNTDQYALVLGIHNEGAIRISNLRAYSDPELKPLNISLPSARRVWKSAAFRTYYIDSSLGNDNYSGISATRPWRSLTNVNDGIFTDGDKILLRSGDYWIGCLALNGSGSAKAPIIVGSYGIGAKPRITAQGNFLATLFLSNTSFITVKDLDISNRGREPQPKLTGVTIEERNFGTARSIVLQHLNVHDVTGSELKAEGGGAGIECDCIGDKRPTRFDGLVIEKCCLSRTDRNGIIINGSYARTSWFPCLNVIVRHNYVDDIGGDGIVPIGCDGALIEHNILKGARMRTPDYAAGIWPWSCDNTIVQYNDVSGVKGTNDGEAFDSDWNCTNSVFQYNYSHNNDGGFMLICDDGTQWPPYYTGNRGTIIRYNVSVNDGEYTFNICGPACATRIYNNTILLGNGSAGQIVNAGYWGGWALGVCFSNNFFATNHATDFQLGQMSGVRFTHNAYYGPFTSRPHDLKPVLNSINSMSSFPLPHFPLLHAGVTIANNGGRDILGVRISPHVAPTIGAYELIPQEVAAYQFTKLVGSGLIQPTAARHRPRITLLRHRASLKVIHGVSN